MLLSHVTLLWNNMMNILIDQSKNFEIVRCTDCEGFGRCEKSSNK